MTIEHACKLVSTKLNIPYETVKQIIMYEFEFTKNVMKDDVDTRDILFNKLFKFKLKPRFKLDKTKNYSPNEYNIRNKI